MVNFSAIADETQAGELEDLFVTRQAEIPYVIFVKRASEPVVGQLLFENVSDIRIFHAHENPIEIF